jgi:hypothetical protein
MRVFRCVFLLTSLVCAGAVLADDTVATPPAAAPVTAPAAAPLAAPATVPVPAERCSAYTEVNGEKAEVPLPSLKVMELTAASGPFVLPKDAPANVSAIQCWRDSILPTKNDYKVFRAGIPFFITAPTNRTLSLAYFDGQLTVTFDKDLLTAYEKERVRDYIALFQKKTARR